MKQLRRALALALCLVLPLISLPSAWAQEMPATDPEVPATDAVQAVQNSAPAAETSAVVPDADEAPAPPADGASNPAADLPADGQNSGAADTGAALPEDADAEGSDDSEGSAPSTDLPPEETTVPDDSAASADAGDVLQDTDGVLPVQEEDPEAEDAIDCTRSAAENPDFVSGYAQLLGAADGYADATSDEGKLKLEDASGIVYASSRSGDRLLVNFDGGEEIACAWVDAKLLRPMSAEEIGAFRNSCTPDARCFNADPLLPLAAIAYSLVPPPAPDLIVDADSLTLGAGEKRALPIRFSDGQTHAVTYTSSNARYASVSADGVVQALRSGKTATIRIDTEFGQSASIRISTLRAPSTVTLQPTKADLCLGDTMAATAKVNAKSASAISWSSSDPSIATVDEGGQITAVAPGSVTIKAAAFNGKSATLKLTVHPDPISIAFEQSDVLLGVDETLTLQTRIAPEDYGSRSYASSDPSVVAVDAATGSIRGVAVGSATITATTRNGISAACSVTVKAAPSCITLEKTAITLGVGEKQPLPAVQVGAPGEDCAKNYSIDLLKSKYVSVTADNCIVGTRAGSATVTVRTYNGMKATLKVTVRKAPRYVTLSPTKATLGVDETLSLTAKLNSGTAGSISYTSSDPAVATVDASGRVRAVAPGSATITAKTFNGRTASCAVQVKCAPSSIALSRPDFSMGVGETCTLTATLSADSAGYYSFRSDNPAVATIDAISGKVKAVAAGSATLWVETYNGVKSSCLLTVKAAPTGVAFQEKSVTLAVGDRYQLLPPSLLGENAASATLKYTSGSTKRLNVSASGLLTAMRAGKTTVTVATYNGKKASLTVTIQAAPKTISFGQSSLYLCVGQQNTPTVRTDTCDCSFSLSSSDPNVATIAADGRTIVACGGGSATITATTYNGKKATLALTVPYLPDSIALEPAAITLGRGDSIALKAVMPQGQDSTLRFESSNPEVASVDEAGRVTAVAPGSAAIRVITYNERTSECAVTVLEAPSRVELSPSVAMRSLAEKQLQLLLTYGAEGEGGRHSFASSNPDVASVSQSGLVTLRSPGNVTISVETYNGLRAECALTVGLTPNKMFFAQAAYSIALGDTVRLDASFDQGCESHSFAIADETIAAAKGDQITGLSIGSTSLTATSFSGLTAGCTLNVVPGPTGIELDQSELSIILGMNTGVALTARVLPDGIGSYRFTSSDPNVARVDALTGEITAVASGDCIITATTYNGFSAQCALQVRGLLDGVKIGIDPGHQAKADPSRETIAPNSRTTKAKVSSGTAGVVSRTPEHVINLQIGLKLRDALEALGAEVYMTRTTADVNISNQERAKMMNALGVDLVLRVHCNGSSSSSKHGMSIYVRKTGACKEESAAAAQLILDAMVAETGAYNRQLHYSDTYTGLNWSTVPSMLMELGYLSNRAEDKLLNSPDYQDKLVKGMINGICTYMGRPTPDSLA